jgi:hypothetical protein
LVTYFEIGEAVAVFDQDHFRIRRAWRGARAHIRHAIMA